MEQALHDLAYAVIVVVTTYVGILAKTLKPKAEAWIESHVSKNTKDMIDGLGEEAYTYAETVFRGQYGQEKLEEALTYIDKQLAKYGIDTSPEKMRTVIEKAWLAKKTGQGGTS